MKTKSIRRTTTPSPTQSPETPAVGSASPPPEAPRAVLAFVVFCTVLGLAILSDWDAKRLMVLAFALIAGLGATLGRPLAVHVSPFKNAFLRFRSFGSDGGRAKP